MPNNHNYGATSGVVEFFPHCSAELQKLVEAAENKYHVFVESLTQSQPAASIRVVASHLIDGLQQVHDLLSEGYSLRADKFYVANAVSLDVTLRKPQELIDAELLALRQEVLEQYENSRYERNKAETARQLQLTLDRSAREAERKAQDKLQKAHEAARAAALADLVESYHGKEAA
ncbi:MULTISPECIES: hypothetical protein [unclassified Pseudomonas]|uniref:hypothetical protein n=1 Tax=unclassified Pseudomonas TaxID=196821 RepID=UPI002446C9AC|nr:MULTISPECIES: hypothetical protein [unclassified Pseudomonas]MDH0892894.1 hypothetical protein [Pseudomonas sp. GD03875]MDH1064632.1 hypothetical protein [Pseudomonas sp. GD03985]